MLCRLGLVGCLFIPTGGALALDIGFQGLFYAQASDNINGDNSPDEEAGSSAGGVISVFGEQKSRLVDAAFSGELDTRRVLSEDNTKFSTVSRFLGAAEFYITPRSWRWYVGDILGGIRDDNAVQNIDDSKADRRNVFVTGPSFAYDVSGVSSTRARALYVNQIEEDDQIESLYIADFSYSRTTTPGSYFGFRVGNIYTDIPANSDRVSGDDYNRSGASVYVNQLSGFLTLYGEIGVTRYDTEDESLNGLNAIASATRLLGPQSSITARLTRSLNDQTLSAVESLIGSGGEGVALRPETAGIFAENRLTLDYSLQASVTSFDAGVGLVQQDYRLLSADANLSADGEDQVQSFAYAALGNRLSERLRGELGISYQRQEYDNRADESDSILASAQLIYRLSRSFELEGSIAHDTATGTRTRFNTGVAEEQEIDVTENRFRIGVRWSPPTRASRELTVQLKSLLQ